MPGQLLMAGGPDVEEDELQDVEPWSPEEEGKEMLRAGRQGAVDSTVKREYTQKGYM